MLYFQSTRDSQTIYSSYDGMDETIIRTLMEELGHIGITIMTEEDYIAAQPAI